MLWLFSAAKKLRQLGVLGMNRRNAACILDHNPRHNFPVVDSKLRMHALCRQIGVATPRLYGAISCHSQLRGLPEILARIPTPDFVVKPEQGSAGRGILVIAGRDGERLLRHDGRPLACDDLRQHLSDILSGMYSLGGRPDQALFQQRIRLHPDFGAVSHAGIPDLRVIVYRGEPVMAMLRLPTRESGGRANLHQGGIGAGIDLDSGITHHAVQRNRLIQIHPDTGNPVVGMKIPFWEQVLAMSRRVAGAVGLGYVGVDLVVDAVEGPMLLEANARPGLAIQIANGQGLCPRLQAIDVRLDRPDTPEPPLLLATPIARRPIQSTINIPEQHRGEGREHGARACITDV